MNLVELLEALKDVPGDAAVDVRVRATLPEISIDATGLLKITYYDPATNTVVLTGDNP